MSIKQLDEYKERVIEIGNVANIENIEQLLSILREILKYVSISCVNSDSKSNSYQNLEIIFNYLTKLEKDNNDTALIMIKSQILTELDSLLSSNISDYKHDVFISHASKDKLAYVNSLKKEIKKLGVDVFYDADILKWGDNCKAVFDL